MMMMMMMMIRHTNIKCSWLFSFLSLLKPSFSCFFLSHSLIRVFPMGRMVLFLLTITITVHPPTHPPTHPPIKFYPARTLRSSRWRVRKILDLLETESTSITVIQLQGYVFFANSMDIFLKVRLVLSFYNPKHIHPFSPILLLVFFLSYPCSASSCLVLCPLSHIQGDSSVGREQENKPRPHPRPSLYGSSCSRKFFLGRGSPSHAAPGHELPHPRLHAGAG